MSNGRHTLIGFLVGCTVMSSAFIARGSSELSLFEKSSAIEWRISQKYRDLLATNLAKDSFTVSAQIKLIHAQGAQQTAGGGVDLERVTLLVGLDSSYDAGYQKELKAWLQKSLQAEFGSKADVSLSQIRSRPEVEKTFGLQDIIGFMSNETSVLFLFAAFLMTWLTSRFVKATREIHQTVSQLVTAEKSAAPQSTDPSSEQGANKGALPQSIQQEIQIKSSEIDMSGQVIAVALGLGDYLDHILSSWLKSGEMGHLKTACLIDTLMAYRAKKTTEGPASSAGQWELNIPIEYRPILAGVFARMPTLKEADRARLLGEVYWELLAVKLLNTAGKTSIFSTLSRFPAVQIVGLLKKQPSRQRTLVLFQLRQEDRERALKAFSPEEREELLRDSLVLGTVKASELIQVEQELKGQIKSHKILDEEIQVQPLVRNFLDSFSVEEEVAFLRKSATPEMKQNIVTLAFFDEWSGKAKELLLAQSLHEEIVSLMLFMPEQAAMILSACSGKRVAALEADLKENKLSAEDRERHLTFLRKRLVALVQNGQIQKEDLFGHKAQAPSPPQETTPLAA